MSLTVETLKELCAKEFLPNIRKEIRKEIDPLKASLLDLKKRVVSWCCGSPNDVTFSLLSTFENTHFSKRMQKFCRLVSTDEFTDKF